MVPRRNALVRLLRRAAYRGERKARQRALAARRAAFDVEAVSEVILRDVERQNEVLAAALYDEGPEARVRRLRASILGEPEPAPSLSGLAAWLPPRA